MMKKKHAPLTYSSYIIPRSLHNFQFIRIATTKAPARMCRKKQLLSGVFFSDKYLQLYLKRSLPWVFQRTFSNLSEQLLKKN